MYLHLVKTQPKNNIVSLTYFSCFDEDLIPDRYFYTLAKFS